MSTLQIIISQLRDAIVLDEIEIKSRTQSAEEKRIAIRVLEQQERAQNPKPLNAMTEQQVKSETAPQKRKLSLASAVSEAVQSIHATDIYVGSVYAVVAAMDVELPGDPSDVRNRIGTELNRLEKAQVLKKVFQGGGNVPNRFRHMAEVEKG